MLQYTHEMGGYRRVKRSAVYQGMKTESAGFTIVETLIVLAVTGALLVSAIALIQGKQNKTEFYTAINNAQQQIQQIINQSASGYYPNNNSFTCQQGVSGAPTFGANGSGSSNQGTNGGCIFLGNAVQFGTNANKSQLAILPIAGNRLNAGDPVTTLADSFPRAIVPATGENNEPADASTTDSLQGGLTVSSMTYTKNNTTTPTGIVAFLAGDPEGTIASVDSGSNLNSGGQQMSLYVVSGSAPNKSAGDASLQIGNTTVSGHKTSNLAAASSVAICLASATTNQSGLIAIDSGLNVKLSIHSGSTCSP